MVNSESRTYKLKNDDISSRVTESEDLSVVSIMYLTVFSLLTFN